MNHYRMWPYKREGSWKVTSWEIQNRGFFGWKTIDSFTDWHAGFNCIKELARKYRPARAQVFGSQKELRMEWDTKGPRESIRPS